MRNSFCKKITEKVTLLLCKKHVIDGNGEHLIKSFYIDAILELIKFKKGDDKFILFHNK